MNGEAGMTGLKLLLKLHHDPHPWDEWLSCIICQMATAQ